jgi:hypothetical protein
MFQKCNSKKVYTQLKASTEVLVSQAQLDEALMFDGQPDSGQRRGRGLVVEHTSAAATILLLGL